MGYLAQMAGLAWHNFTSAAAGIGVALALARGLTRRGGPGGPRTLGNFWADLVRATLYVLLPLSFLVALFLVSQGVVQTLAPNLEVQTLEGVKQVIALGPVASQEAIKMLGTNGGGFFNANSAHPFENPTPLVNLVQMLLIFLIPAGLTFTYGRMAQGHAAGLGALRRHGRALPRRRRRSPTAPSRATTRRSPAWASTRPPATWRARRPGSAWRAPRSSRPSPPTPPAAP